MDNTPLDLCTWKYRMDRFLKSWKYVYTKQQNILEVPDFSGHSAFTTKTLMFHLHHHLSSYFLQKDV